MGKILIVDDELAIAQLISDVLNDEGFDTVIRTDGKQAYDYTLYEHLAHVRAQTELHEHKRRHAGYGGERG